MADSVILDLDIQCLSYDIDGLLKQTLDALVRLFDRLIGCGSIFEFRGTEFAYYWLGRIIPGFAWARRTEDYLEAHERLLERHHASDPLGYSDGLPSRPPLLALLLESTAYLPFEIVAEDPDAARLGSRTLRLNYLRRSAVKDSGRALEDALVVAVAPMAISEEDVIFEIPKTASSYGIKPDYPLRDLSITIKDAINKGVELLLLPEAVLNEKHTGRFSRLIRKYSKDYLLKNGEEPRLLYVFAGVSGSPKLNSDRHRNYVAIFDSLGVIVATQEKSFRWNLTQGQIVRFGIISDYPWVTPPLMENIDAAEEICVVDLDGFGRVLNFICADTSFNVPGDWLLTHLRTDWLHAPIMDQSVCWTFYTGGGIGPWITERAHRAACACHGRVLVTNSVSLSHRVNRANQAHGDPRTFATCGIGILIDGMKRELTFSHLLVDINQGSPIMELRVWGDGWGPFPPP